MRKVALACLLLSIPLAPARAQVDKDTLMDMQDEFELRQMGLDSTTLRMRNMQLDMQIQMDRLRREFNQQLDHERFVRSLRDQE